MQKSLKDIFRDVPNIDERSAQFLINALEKSNLDGFDYLEYKQSLGALAALNIDEATAFKSAFATASTMGLTQDKLQKTAHYYLKILEKERSQFEQAVQQQVQRQIAGKKQQSDTMMKSIEQKKNLIEKMRNEIAQHQEKIIALQSEIESAHDKIGATKQNFEQTYIIIEEEIKEDISKISMYLG